MNTKARGPGPPFRGPGVFAVPGPVPRAWAPFFERKPTMTKTTGDGDGGKPPISPKGISPGGVRPGNYNLPSPKTRILRKLNEDNRRAQAKGEAPVWE